nr:MAG TPA: hypothetical protein [Caudoviricetes sp.]
MAGSPASRSDGSKVCVMMGFFMVVRVVPRISFEESSCQSYSMLESVTRVPRGDHVGVPVSPVLRYAIRSSRSTVCPAVVLKVVSAIFNHLVVHFHKDLVILVTVFIHGKKRGSRCRLNTDDAPSVSNVRWRFACCPIAQGVKQLVSFEPFVIAISRLHAVDDLELVLRLIPAENVFLYDVRCLNRRQRHRFCVSREKFKPNKINWLVREFVEPNKQLSRHLIFFRCRYRLFNLLRTSSPPFPLRAPTCQGSALSMLRTNGLAPVDAPCG